MRIGDAATEKTVMPCLPVFRGSLSVFFIPYLGGIDKNEKTRKVFFVKRYLPLAGFCLMKAGFVLLNVVTVVTGM